MVLYFLRHGRADWPDWKKADDDRPLTRKGRKESRRVGKFLRKMDVAPKSILTSPLPRAKETAEITASRLGLKVKEESALSPGFGEAKVRAILKRNRGADLMLVGHEPDFSSTIAALTGARVKLAKGGLARVDLDEAGTAGKLIWLIAPKMAKA